MRAEEYITERATGVLFHFTLPKSALSIVSTGIFKLTNALGSRSEEKLAPAGYPYYLSTTRSKVGDYHLTTGNSAVMFVLDGNWFSGRYPVKPVDYWEGSWRSSNRGSESEDRVFSKTPTIPADAIQSVHVLLKRQDEVHSAIVRKLLLVCKQRDLPVYLYEKASAWRLQDTRRALPLSQALKTYLLKGQGYDRGQSRRTLYIKPWIELLMQNNPSKLTPGAHRRMKELTYYPIYPGDDFGLTNDLTNERKPSSTEYDMANKLVSYLVKNKLTVHELIKQLSEKWKKIVLPKEVVAEREWEVDDSYTEQDIRDLHSAAMVVENYARNKMGITVKFSSHYFDQAIKKRGAGKIVPQLMLDSAAKLLKRGLNYFRDKPDMTSYAFQDNINGMIFEVLKHNDKKYEIRTVVRDIRWLGRSEKIVYED